MDLVDVHRCSLERLGAQLAFASGVRTDRIDVRAGPDPLRLQEWSAGWGRRAHDVCTGGLFQAYDARPHPVGETLGRTWVAIVREAFEPVEHDLVRAVQRVGLCPATDEADRFRSAVGKMLRGDRACRPGA